VEEGDIVTEGQVLGRMFPAPHDPRVAATVSAEVRAAEAGYRDAEARVHEAAAHARQAEREVARRRPLSAIGALTAEALERMELAAEATLAGARAGLLGTEPGTRDAPGVDLTAPVAGRVLSVSDESERVVPAGASLLQLAHTGGLEVVLDMLTEDAVRVDPGQLVRVTDWGRDTPLHGVVRTVTLAGYTKISALGVEEQRVDVIADLQHAPWTLGTGYRVQGEVVVWQGASVLSVPTSALFRAGDTWQVFVIDAGRARRREVTIGYRNVARAEIERDLIEGEQVILFPSEEVDDGVRVRVQ
jgi:HlyD family secretion protein